MKVKAHIAAPILLLFIFIMNKGAAHLPDTVIGSGDDRYLTTAFLQIFILALPAVIFCRLRGEGYMKGLRLRGFGAGSIPLIVFALLLIFFGSSLINFLIHAAFPDTTPSVTISSEEGTVGGLYLILTAAAIPAVTEEFLFRGILLREYESMGVPAAAVMSSLMFAMLHGSAAGLVTYLFCGAVLAMTLYATRSLLAVTLVHLLANTASLFFGDIIYRVVSSQGTVLFCFALACLTLLFAILFFGECERIYATLGFLDADSSYTGQRKRGSGMTGLLQSIISPPFMILVLLFIITLAVGL